MAVWEAKGSTVAFVGTCGSASRQSGRRPGVSDRRPSRAATRMFAISPQVTLDIAGAAVLPLWGLMLAAPRSALTKKLVIEPYGLVPVALCYVITLFAVDPSSFPPVPLRITPEWLVQAFQSPAGVSAGWIHYLVLDAMLGRWITIDSEERGVFAKHSIVLSFLLGPVGFLSHVATRTIYDVLKLGGPAEPASD